MLVSLGEPRILGPGQSKLLNFDEAVHVLGKYNDSQNNNHGWSLAFFFPDEGVTDIIIAD